MNKLEWLIVTVLVIMGLICLTASATTMWGSESIGSYFNTFVHVCLWMGLPVLIVGIIYIIFLKKEDEK